MALANVGAMLAKWGKRVLIVDWDLEAPGIEKFFEKWLTGSRRENPGLIDLISAFDRGEPIDWRECLLRANLSTGAEVAMISAGREDGDYTARLQKIDWEVLFRDKKFGAYLERLRNEWLLEYDFILIDSRTGVTDIGGICTIHLPDIVLTLFTASGQSLAGVKDVMMRARRAHADLPVDRKRLVIVPVPARDESSNEYKLAKEWRQRFAQELDSFFREWAPESEKTEEILDRLKIPYFAYWSFGERLPVMEEDPDNPKTLAFSYQLVARLLLGKLNWTEVKEGKAATEAAAEHKAKAEKLALEATQVRIDAQREFAEREMARLKEKRDQFLKTRWDPEARSQFLAAKRMMIISWLGIIISCLGGIMALWVVLDYALNKNTTKNMVIVGALGGGIFGLGGYFWQFFQARARESRLIAEALQRERVYFDGFAGPYVGQNLETALRQFIEATEFILQSKGQSGADRPMQEKVSSPLSPPPSASLQFPTSDTLLRPLQSTPASDGSPPVVSQPLEALSSQEPGGPYDIFVSYRANTITTAWLQEFIPLFSGFLASRLGEPPRIFIDTESISRSEKWRDATAAALQSARCLLVIVSPAYFQSSYCMRELESFLAHRHAVFPVMVEKTEDLGPLRSFNLLDFTEFFYVGPALTQSPLYIDFQRSVRQLAQRVAEMLHVPA